MPEILDDFLAALDIGSDPLVELAAQKIAFLPEELQGAAIDILRALLDDPVLDRRWWAARALGEIPASEVILILIPLLKDPTPEMRQCAALGLSQQPNPQAIPVLVNLMNDMDPLTARVAGEALAAIGEPAVEPLLECMQHYGSNARLNAVRALARIADERAVPALFAVLDDPSLGIAYWADEGLERMGIGMTFFQP